MQLLLSVSLCLPIFNVLIISSVVAQDLFPPEVTTKLGKIRGRRVRQGVTLADEYLGIPYAKAPVNDLRFKKTVPIERYSDTVEATKMPPACPQYSTRPFPWGDYQPGQHEDCLYLNIWTPSSSGVVPTRRKMPVIFWIFGGGFYIGSIRKEDYNGKALATRGEVVVVTVSYRLSSLGFLYSGTADAPGNVGIHDVLEGLRWVRENIEVFGGDKNRVTLLGQSAGSIIISILATSPLAKGLYKRVIMESGSAAYLLADNDETPMLSQQVAVNVSCANSSYTLQDHPKEVVACLRGVNAKALVKATAELMPKSSRVMIPRFGDDISPKNPRLALQNGEFHHTEILAGDVQDEGSFSLPTANPEYFGLYGEKYSKLNKSYAEQILRSTLNILPDRDRVIRYYLDSVSNDDFDAIRRQTYTAIGDFTLLCPTVYTAESFAQRKNKVFYYVFVHRPSKTPWAPWMGVVHASEVEFVFGKPVMNPSDYTLGEFRLSSSMIEKWSNFAKTGSPGRNWPQYSRDDPKFYVLNTSIVNSYGRGPHQENCNVYRSYFGF